MSDARKTALSVCLITAVLALSVAGCAGGGTANTPSAVAEAFLKGSSHTTRVVLTDT